MFSLEPTQLSGVNDQSVGGKQKVVGSTPEALS